MSEGRMNNEKLYNNSTKHITIHLVPKENFQDRVGILISIQILYNHYTGTVLNLCVILVLVMEIL